MTMLETKLDTRALTRTMHAIHNLASGDAAVDALNAGAIAGRQFLIQRAFELFNLPRTYIQSLFTLRQAKVGNLEARIIGRRRDVQLRQFEARQEWGTSAHGKRIGAGVSVHVLRASPRKTIKNAFFIPLNNGAGIGVAMRAGRGRYPLRVLYGPAPSSVIVKVSGEALDLAAATMSQQLGKSIRNMAGAAESEIGA
jgi:hypothetical protein